MSLQFSQNITEDLARQMVLEGLITEDQLLVARVSREDLGEDLGQILLKKGFVSQAQLLSFIGKTLSIPYISLEGVNPPEELVQKVPLYLARRYHAVPVRREGNAVVVAMADPMDPFALDDLRMSLRSEIKRALGLREDIDRFIDRFYGQQNKEKDKDKNNAQIEMIGYAQEEAEASGEKLEKIATGPRIVQTVNEIIVQAFQDKASDIHIEPGRDALRVRFRIDGLLEERQIMGKEMHLPLISRIKIMGGLNIAERRIPQDGRVRIKIGGNVLDLRVSTYPTLHGEKLVMRLLAKDSAVSFETMGFAERDRKVFVDLISRSYGIFLTTGPTGSGKTTTLYSALKRINSPEKNIISIEDPVEAEVVGVSQAQINPKAGVTFASALRSILRQDPDVIMIGEIRDAETAEIAVRAAITGHLVLSTLHTNTASGAIARLVDLGVEPFMISSAIIGVLAQRLVRRICPECCDEIDPDYETLGTLASSIKHCFKGQGCPACRSTGYLGRVGVFEMAPTGESVRKKIASGANEQEIEEEFRRMGVKSLLEDGIDKVNHGVTTVEEILRVMKES